MWHLTSLSLVFTLLEAANAAHLPFEGRVVRGPPVRRMHRRADVSGNGITVANTRNSEYISNITLGGQTVRVMLDTGSSDLWATGNIPNTNDLGKSVTLSYAVGKAAGNVHTADLTIDDYNVSSQAFLLVSDTSTFQTDIHQQGYDGLLGLGPNTGSLIREKVDSASGDTMLNRIFQQNKTTQNYITFLLNRETDQGEKFQGSFTISELAKGYEKVTDQPKLSVDKVPGLTDKDQHWQMLTDKDGFIGPDGQPIKTSSVVPKAPDGQLVAVIDSGFTLPQVPRSVSDAIYGRVQGAKWDSNNQLWTVPCDQMLNVSFKFGGVTYPVHPLDTVSQDFNLTDPGTGKTVCAGVFQPITTAFSLLGEYDMILGMAFLRNAYTLLDYGNFIDGTTNDRGNPYVQMLAITDANDAHKDFVQARMGGQDNTADAKYALLDASQMQHSPESDAEKKQHLEGKVLSHWPYILAGCLVVTALLVGLCVWRCCCRRRGKGGARAGYANMMPGFGSKQQAYQPVGGRAPQGVSMQPMGGSYTDLSGHSGHHGGGHHGGYDGGYSGGHTGYSGS